MDILASLPPTPAPSFWARFFGLDRTIRQQQETIAALSKELTQERAYRQSAGLVASADPNLPWQETPRAALSLEPGDVGEPEEPPIVASDRQEPGDDTEDPASPPIPQEVVERAQQMLGSLVTGYKMSVQRIDRALEQLGLEPISAVGQSFDPEYMEVLEAVPDSGYPPGEVLEEVRRGYVWRGRVFRYAQVRVARS
jgi:hypothetical protein